MIDCIPSLVVLIVAGVLTLSVGPLALSLISNSVRRRQLQLHGERATVEILDMRDTWVTMSLNPRVEISVRMSEGTIRKFKMFVFRMRFPRPGEKINILNDPADPSVVIPV